MKKAVIFGATANTERIKAIQKAYEVIFATDNDRSKYGKYLTDNIVIKDICELSKGGYDDIVIASIIGQNEIFKQLRDEFCIEESRIILDYVDFPLKARKQFLSSFSQLAHEQNISGAVCEVGVFRGEFAKEINKMFPDRKCYLFDTFSGFDQKDIEKETAFNFSSQGDGHLNTTSVELVLSKMTYKDKIIINKGYFPDTFDAHDEKFYFVNLDVDLYNPIAQGLEIFWPRMTRGGAILVHDYFHPSYRGVKAAVVEFAQKNNIHFYPIGDGISIAFYK